jgi:chemotaxis protein methyltransferase CheR
VKTFQTVDVPGARVYQKVTPAPAPAPEPVRSEPAPGKPRQTAPERVIPPKPIVKARSQQPRAPAPSEAPPDDIETLRQLADRGDWKRAAEYGQRLLAQDRLNPAAHYYLALVFENLGMVAESERSLRQAIYLDRKFALAHYHLGLALKRSRQMNASARSFANVLKALAALPDHATVTAGPGISATELKELAKMHLENAIGL